MTGKKAKIGQKTDTRQIDKFRDLAREIETVDSEEPLNEALRKVAKTPPPRYDKPKKAGGS
ncbi:hypothetical protein FJ950_02735 [Mesorhizobium sp. B2-3-14]|uniref:hypothetical protein n=1 Tax=Mesorhizobium sp. B2-3-14 TaxID=2589950 RepID=UPI001129F501|nr:hypothetical protein [Mesorhizobium sp. B2-3-14]TPL89288.1 hypothetical protein FJ950_02735 [Mesorhizobium sp. B2-3-14]